MTRLHTILLFLVNVTVITLTPTTTRHQLLECGFDQLEQLQMRQRSWFNGGTGHWLNGVITWGFVSNGEDDSEENIIHNDEITGLSKSDVETIKNAMKQIESKTCIRFKNDKILAEQPWLFISRNSRGDNMPCEEPYIQNNLVGKNINGFGDIYRNINEHGCFGGASAGYGPDYPQTFVISQANLDEDDQYSIGLVVHELLHNLGLGHTQKRKDASEYIDIQWDNIDETAEYNYLPCDEKICNRYNTFDTEYDCSSIMHYGDTFFLKTGLEEGAKTMIAKDPNMCSLSSPNIELRYSDILLLNRLYCLEEVKSTNYPDKYPIFARGQLSNFSVVVDAGHVIRLWFTNFEVEYQASCGFDWVKVIDHDGTILLNKTCGLKIPKSITSKTNRATIQLYSDQSKSGMGFRAVYEAVNPNPPKEITSTNYPNRYPNFNPGQISYFPVVVDTNYLIKLRFIDFDVEVDESCDYDWVKVVDDDGTFLLDKTCGFILPDTIISKTNKLKIQLFSDSSIAGRGFKALYETAKPNPPKEVTSTNYPNEYPNFNPGEKSYFPVVVDANYLIKLRFIDFDVEDDESCAYDWVKVVDDDGTVLLDKTCGFNLPHTIISKTNKVKIQLFSDSSVAGRGFKAFYEAVKPGTTAADGEMGD